MTHLSQAARIGARIDATGGAARPAVPIAPYRRPAKPGRYGAPSAARGGRTGTPIGAVGGAGAIHATPDGAAYDAELVIYRLEEAGTTLLSVPHTGWSTRMRSSSLEIVRSALEAYGWGEKQLRPPVPDAAKIDRMDQALAWIPLIPRENVVLRRIVGARCLVSPMTERHLYPWRRLAGAIGADHKAVQRWHAQGIDLIVAALNRGEGK